MNPAELNKLCQQAGGEGALWRLVRSWDPDKLLQWLAQEKRVGLSPDQAVAIVAEVMAGAAFVLAQSLGGDKKGAMLGDRGLVNMLRMSVAHKLDQVGGAHVIVPSTNGTGTVRGLWCIQGRSNA